MFGMWMDEIGDERSSDQDDVSAPASKYRSIQTKYTRIRLHIGVRSDQIRSAIDPHLIIFRSTLVCCLSLQNGALVFFSRFF